MLTCGAIRRSRDKKPDGNKLDAVSASSVSIAELDSISYRMPDEKMISMTRDNENQNSQTEKESLTMRDIFTGIGMSLEEYASLSRQSSLAADLYGEPEIAAFRSNADRHSGLIR